MVKMPVFAVGQDFVHFVLEDIEMQPISLVPPLVYRIAGCDWPAILFFPPFYAARFNNFSITAQAVLETGGKSGGEVSEVIAGGNIPYAAVIAGIGIRFARFKQCVLLLAGMGDNEPAPDAFTHARVFVVIKEIDHIDIE